MNDLKTAAQQALEALEQSETFVPYEGFGMARKEAERRHQAAITALRAALAQQKDPTDPGNDVDVLREHVRHLERRVRELHAQQAELAQEPVAKVELMMTGGNAGLATRIVEIDDHLRERLRPGQLLYTAPPQRTMVPLTEKEMYAVDEEARKNFRLSQKGPRGQQITYWDGLTPWLIRAVERAHGIKE